jgi:hypothetical protein
VGLTGVVEEEEAMSAVKNQKKKKNFFFYSEGKRREREKSGRGSLKLSLVFSLLLIIQRGFILAVINVWGLVVGTQITKC